MARLTSAGPPRIDNDCDGRSAAPPGVRRRARAPLTLSYLGVKGRNAQRLTIAASAQRNGRRFLSRSELPEGARMAERATRWSVFQTRPSPLCPQLAAPDSVEEEEEEEEEASGSREDAACSPDVAPVRRQARSPDATPVPPPTPSGEAETAQPARVGLAAGRGSRRRERTPRPGGGRAAAPRRASGKMKTKGSAGKRGWGSKAVDRSLYGKRDYASKNPVLSPITESLPCASRSPTPCATELQSSCQRTAERLAIPAFPWRRRAPAAPRLTWSRPRAFGAAESDSDGLKVEEERHGDGHGAGDSVTSEPDAGGGAPEPVSGGGRRSSGSRRSGAKGRSKGRRSSLYRPPPLTEEDEEAQSPQTLPLPGGEQSEGEGAVRGGEGGEISDTATERKGEEGSGETGGDGIGPPALPPTDGAAVAPPPWQQAEFCIEDVLQAPPRGGRRSVRRSLRNQSLQDPSATGLAWVPSSSPTDRRPTRRRTRGRRSSAHAPPTLPEDASPGGTLLKTKATAARFFKRQHFCSLVNKFQANKKNPT
ncbi:hypothetical protein ANANG_G00189090 [Anguilla anguilla]|uniref:Uncharacterized protein n=1 Tax=Anguilla anguilla TaxID=7936 RepID=A0A9D3RRE3_ANGAN|nr:hypothetical protein ANANG_G00189090 [Anguilla anguilla]